MKRMTSAAAAAVLLLSGCGTEKNAEYKNISDLGSAYQSAIGDGVKCMGTTNKIETHGWVQDQCGPTGIIMLFTSDAKREEIKQKNPLETGRNWVQGKNWLIEADQFQAEKAHNKLGGELLTK